MITYHLTNPPMKGNDLKPLQQALYSAKFYGGAIDGIFGQATGQACKIAKYRLGYPTRAVLPTGGQTLFNYLTGAATLPLAFKARRKARGYSVNKGQQQRDIIVSHALWGVANSGAIHYAQVRPMDHLRQVRALPWTSDCSEFVTTIYCWAGADDPNMLQYRGEGWTGTLLDHGVTIPLSAVQPGDLVLFDNHHVCVVVDCSNPQDPYLVSHGSERGPFKIKLSVESSYQKGYPVIFKRYIGG